MSSEGRRICRRNSAASQKFGGEPFRGRGVRNDVKTANRRASRRNVVITGASAGVGRAVVRRFAADGANIGLIARDQARLNQVVAEVEKFGGAAAALSADVADPEKVELAAARFEERFGPIDVWINCAMVTILAPVDETSPDEFKRVTEVTYLGCVHGTLSALRRMRAQGRGTIVQVGSALAYRSIPLQAPYCAAKHAIVGFSDSLRSELIRQQLADQTHGRTPAGRQHAAIRLGAQQDAAPAAALPPIFQPEVAARWHPLRGLPSAPRILGRALRHTW